MDKQNKINPYLIEFPKIGDSSMGYISIGEELKEIPFASKRCFWTYHTPDSIVRGRHTHYTTEQVLVAVSGQIILNTEALNGEKQTFYLDSPTKGVYVPAKCWHTMQYSHSAVQLVFASTLFDPADYIRSFEEFKEIQKAYVKENT